MFQIEWYSRCNDNYKLILILLLEKEVSSFDRIYAFFWRPKGIYAITINDIMTSPLPSVHYRVVTRTITIRTWTQEGIKTRQEHRNVKANEYYYEDIAGKRTMDIWTRIVNNPFQRLRYKCNCLTILPSTLIDE